MTEESTETGPTGRPGKEGYERGGVERLFRPREGRLVAGVCAGLAHRTGIDSVIFRVGFALLVVAHGQGILLYIAASLLMPEDPERMSPAEHALRRRFDAGTVLIILGALLGLGVLVNAAGNGVSGDALTVTTVFALVLLVAHARKVDFADVVRTLPDRLQGHPPDSPVRPEPSAPSVSFQKAAPLPAEMIDLATLGSRAHPAHDAAAPSPASAAPLPPGGSGRPSESARTAAHRPLPVLSPVTLLLVLIVAAAMIPVAAGHPANNAVQITAATGLAIIGLGLVVGSLFGRGRALVACGTVLSLGLMCTSVIAEAPVDGRYGDVEWRPVDAARTEQTYRMVVGGGRLDLTALPLTPGQRMRVNVDLKVGQLKVTVPNTARVELDLRVMLGDATVEQRVVSGPNARVNEVLEPEGGPKNAPTIELHVRGAVGDLEVARAW
jgi:phage shock protein PspC (stress-responsive transcriptional regulator)